MSFEEVKQSAADSFRQNMDAGYMPVVTCWLKEGGQARVITLLPGSMEQAHRVMVADFIHETIVAPAQLQEAA